MIERLLPAQIDAAAKGNLIAALLLFVVAGLKLLMGINATAMTQFVAGTVDGIPLDHYGPQAAQAVMAFFALWGLEQILLAFFGLLAAVRYRALGPLGFCAARDRTLWQKGSPVSTFV